MLARKTSWLIAIGFAAVGCTSPRVEMSPGPRAFQATDYQQVYDRWTREEQILPVDGIENVLSVRATMLSYEFRSAYAVKVGHDLGLTGAQRDELEREQLAAAAAGHEFFLSVMSGIKDADELEPEEGPWNIRLEDDRGRRVSPASIEKIRRPSTADLQYFGYDRLHRTGYRVRFPFLAQDGQPIIGENTQHFSLTFSSPLGQGALRWQTAVGPGE